MRGVSIRDFLRVAAFFLLIGFLPAEGLELYVSTEGSDLNLGTLELPFKTIGHACSLAVPGVTITVTPGVYTDYSSDWGLRLRSSGTAAKPMVIKSQIKGAAVIDGQNVTNRYVAISLEGSYNIIDGFEIRGGPKGGIKVWGNYNQIVNNQIHHNGNVTNASSYGQDGIYSDKATHDNVYGGNSIHDNGRAGSNLDHGLYLCGDNELIINNVLRGNAAYGLQIAGYGTVSSMKVYNNVMAFNGKGGVILWQSLYGVDIKNNIIYRNAGYGIDSWAAHGSGVAIDRNLVFGNGAGVYNFAGAGSDFAYTRGTTIAAEPLFVNPTSTLFDARLTAGSPAINAGLDLSGLFGVDRDGAPRATGRAWDMGAYGYTNLALPDVFLSTPAENATLSGSSVTVSAEPAAANIVGVQFKINGGSLGIEDTNAPYRVTFNTTLVPDGPHLLGAVSRSAAGELSTSVPLLVLVKNSNAPPTISKIADQTIDAGGSTAALSFSVSDAETAADSLTAWGSSSNPILIRSEDLVLHGFGSNRTVTVTPAPDQFGNARLTLTVSDGKTNTSSSFWLKVKPAVMPEFVYLPFEAESALLAAPIAVASNSGASEARYAVSSAFELGAATFEVNIPVSGAYSVWCRVAAPDVSHDSFYVSVDGGTEDIFDAAEGGRTNAWQWTLLNGRGGTNLTVPLAINPRTFLLSTGVHHVVFRGREPTGLDQILLTNDPDFVPSGIALMAPEPVRISSIQFGPAGFIAISWPSVPGKTYRVVYTTNLAQWFPLGPSQIATSTMSSRSDVVSGNRDYRVITLP